ncbi:MAG: ABC transporter ATP-binding protein [Eubacteriales bacterium]|nr:ABC transporter ATP-binding protein [Eubacteriales bacterium]
MSLLKCENLSFAYDGVTVVKDLNFNVEEGNYLCIIGENGAGKSTLVKGLLRLKKPSAGKVEMGADLKAVEIGYLPQQTQIQKDFPASVREVVLSGCLNRMGLRPFYSRAEKERARENMEALEILELQHQCYRDLSGGQQQRVLLARALCAAQKLILLDEPVSGLDPVATRTLYAQIALLNKKRRITVIMVSHDIDASLRDASHILHLGQEGQLFFGTVEEYRRSAVYHAFLGEKAVPMWRHAFPNKSGQAAPREAAEPTVTESSVKVSARRGRSGKHKKTT